jgi:hypothetical protein
MRLGLQYQAVQQGQYSHQGSSKDMLVDIAISTTIMEAQAAARASHS